MVERAQLNIRFDGKGDIIEAIRAAAAANDESLNRFCIRVLAEASGVASESARAIALTPEIEALIEAKVAAAVENAIAQLKLEEDSTPKKHPSLRAA